MPRFRIQVKYGNRWLPYEDKWYGSEENATRMLTVLHKFAPGLELKVGRVRKKGKRRRPRAR